MAPADSTLGTLMGDSRGLVRLMTLPTKGPADVSIPTLDTDTQVSAGQSAATAGWCSPGARVRSSTARRASGSAAA